MNQRLTDLIELSSVQDGDFLYVVDVSDTTDGVQGTGKKITKFNMNLDTVPYLGSVSPTSTPTGTGKAYWFALEDGTYTNFGGVVVLPNSIAIISRDSLGAYSISQNEISLTGYVKFTDVVNTLVSTSATLPLSANQGRVLDLKIAQGIPEWTAKPFLSGDETSSLGKLWRANANTLSTDIPGTSSKWTDMLTGVSNEALFNKITGITFTNGSYINPNGTISTHVSLSYSSFVPLNGVGTIKSIIYTFGGSASYLFYDANQVLITGYLNTKNSLTIPETIYTAVPLNAKFARFVTAINKQSEFYVDAINLISNDLQQTKDDLVTTNDNIDDLSNLLGVVVSGQNIATAGFAFDISKYYNSSGNIITFSGQPNEYNITLDYFRVAPSQSYIQNSVLVAGHIVFYDSQKGFISAVASGSTTTNYAFTTPANCAYIRTTYHRTNGLRIINNGASYVLPAETTTATASRLAIEQGASSLGALDFEPIPLTGYNHVIFNGQSLSVGAVSVQPISTVALTDCFMIGANVGQFTGVLTPLTSQVIGNSGEQPVVGAVNALKKYLNKTPYRNVKLIGSSVGSGGKSVEQLSKLRTESNGLTTGNEYNTKFIPCLDAAKTAVGATPIVCTAIVWMQGEANQDPADYAGAGMTTSLPQTHDKNTYKTLLRQLKNDMQADIMTKYGQTQKPLFFVYQTSVFYAYNGNIPITQAQYELAQEDDDVILLNPHYYCPTAQSPGGGHLNANGYRWYSEQVAKSLSSTLLKNEEFTSVMPKKFTIDKYNIYIDCLVPTPPLVIDIKAIQLQTGNGFTVKLNGTVRTVSAVEIIGGTTIKLTVAVDLSVGTVDVSYGGSEQSGRGNVRDSDRCLSFTNYVNDTTLTSNTPPYTPLDSNNVNFYGRKYPLWNWLNNFYINVQ